MFDGIPKDLKQPLTAIAHSTKACKRLLAKPEPDIPKMYKALEQITAQAARALEILRLHNK